MKQIHGRQAAGLWLAVLLGWALTMDAGGGRGGWLPLLLAGLCSLPFAALCCLPCERLRCDWFSVPRAALGRICGAGYRWALCALAFWSLSMTALSGVIFLRTVSGGRHAVWLLAAAILLCAGAAAQNSAEALAKWAQPIVLLVLAALAISVLLSLPQLRLRELLPLSDIDGASLPRASYLLLSAPFGEVLYAAAVLGGHGTRIRNGLLAACLSAGILLAALYARNLCLLGAAGAQGAVYPTYTAAGVLTFGEAFQRSEVLISGSLLVCTVARAALILAFFSCCAAPEGGKKRVRALWCAAAAAGVLCVLCAGTGAAFARAQALYQRLFLPLAFLAALALLPGALRKK